MFKERIIEHGIISNKLNRSQKTVKQNRIRHNTWYSSYTLSDYLWLPIPVVIAVECKDKIIILQIPSFPGNFI
jgi:hypothetical protein